MATSNIISIIRLLIAFTLPISLIGQERIIKEYDNIIVTGYDAVIYLDPNGQKFTTDTDHPYFLKYQIDLSVADHVKNMEAEIFELKEINNHVRQEYLDNPTYFNTNDQGAIDTRDMFRRQFAKREFAILQCHRTIDKFKSRL